MSENDLTIDETVIEEDMKEWQINEEEIGRPRIRLGSGYFGRVFETTYKDHVVAIKIMKHAIDPVFFYNEIRIMRGIQHEHVPKIFGFIHNPSKMAIVMERVRGLVLHDYLRFYDINYKQSLSISHQLTSVLRYLHFRNIVYRDMKPDNVVIDPSKFRIYLVDFGLAHQLSSAKEQITGMCGTPGYIAPEVIEGRLYGMSSDIYSLGVTMYVISTQSGPTHPRKMRQLLYRYVPKELRDLILDCLNRSAALRPKAYLVELSLMDVIDEASNHHKTPTSIFSCLCCPWFRKQ